MVMTKLIIGTVGLVALESNVESFLSKVVTWRNQEEDAEQSSLSLSMSGIAYKNWRTCVKIAEDPAAVETANMSVASPEEAQTVERLLCAIQSAFQSVEQANGRHNVPNIQESSATSTPRDELGARANEVNKKRQSSASILQETRWIFCDQEKLKRLEETVSTNVRQLVRMLPQNARKLQERLAAVDSQEIVPPEPANLPKYVLIAERDSLERIRTSAVDSIMQQMADHQAQKVEHRHRFEKPVAEGDAQALFGDDIDGNVIPQGKGSVYINPLARGNAQAIFGDRFNKGEFFTRRK